MSDTLKTTLNEAGEVEGIYNQGRSIEKVTFVDSATYTVLATDNIIHCTVECTVTIPTAQMLNGRILNIKNATAGSNITLATEGAETIEGDATQVISAGDLLKTYCYDSNWYLS